MMLHVILAKAVIYFIQISAIFAMPPIIGNLIVLVWIAIIQALINVWRATRIVMAAQQ